MRSYRSAACAALLLLSCSGDAPTFPDAATDADVTDANTPVTMLPASVDLELADCGGSTSRTLSVENDGNAALEYSFAFSDEAFTIVPASGTILPGATATFTVTADVSATAAAGVELTATLTATTNLPGSPHSIPVTVTPRGAHITITPPSVGFGQVEAGTTSTGSVITVANTGNASATINIAPPGGEFSRIFGTAGTITLQGGQSAEASFTYAPGNIGDDGGLAPVTVTGLHCGNAPSSIALTGSGAVTGGVLVQGIPVDFGSIACGTSSGSATVTLMNTASIAVPFSASFPTDADGDHLRYSVTPASGNVPAGSTTMLTVTRLAIALPATPRAYDATLRITTTIPAVTNTDAAVRQTLSGPFLAVTPVAADFGYASVGRSRSTSVSIMNTGTAAATVQASTALPFGLQVAASVAAGATAVGTMSYTPAALGAAAGSGTITAAGACSAPQTLTFTAGNGPEATIYTYGATATCPAPAALAGPIYAINTGNQQLSITCAETSSTNLAPQFTPSPLVVGAGSGGEFAVAVSPGAPVRAGSTTAQIRCTTNEPAGNLYDFPYTRTLDGADLTLTAPAPLDFTCFVAERKPYTITSAATSTLAAPLTPTSMLVFPLAHDFDQPTIQPGGSDSNDVTTYSGGGSFRPADGVGDPCLGTANPGDPVFNGTVGVLSGSGSGVCSVTPASLPVVLRQGTPQ